MTKLNKLPAYMEIFANKVYSCAKLSNVLDDNRIVRLRSLWSDNQIVKDLLSEITKNAHVLQIGLTFGNEIDEVYNKVFKKGKFDIFDISETQINRAKAKYLHHNINIMNYNAAMSWDEKYDVVICYNLLHDLPPVTRQKVMDNALNSLTNGGKAIFIDCAEPINLNPFKWLIFWFNRLYRPFAESLWNAPIESFCLQKDKFRWQHKYYRGRMFQKVVAVRKILSNEDVLKLTKIFRGEK
ncbi:MAG: class I SAM-dependent methyltransferase [Alphaproteobacteria bacterium]|nr:class I SAM-dependent methyltransferase [Alphaproteobacteria bacterium]